MNIKVEYRDTFGVITHQTHSLSRLAFAKHLAIAGQGYAPKPQKLIRIISMFFHYSPYMQTAAFNNDSFSVPPDYLSDPTEKGQFSNLAGKAIADFLSKRIDNSLLTVNYEAAMRIKKMPVIGNRPDLIAYANNSTFAIEAKGYSNGTGVMSTHKNQALTGGIPVNFSVACVSHNLYKRVKCKYYDPVNENIPFDNKTFKNLSKNYYNGLLGFLDKKYFRQTEFAYQGEQFYAIQLSEDSFKLFENDFNITYPYWKILGTTFPKLILPKSIREFAEKGISNEIKPFSQENNNQNKIYIDNDRIGLMIGRPDSI